MSDFKSDLKYPITIEGIEVADSQRSLDAKVKITITRTLTWSLQSECLSNSCVYSILIVTLL